MARAKEETVFCSFRMYLDNPKHMKVAKVLKKIEEERQQNKGLTKNQFIINALEYYIDHYYLDEDSKILVTRKELKELKKELREELQEMLRTEWLRSYNPLFFSNPMPMPQMVRQASDENIDDTIADLVSDWD